MSSDKPTTVTLDTNVPLELLDKRDNIQDVEQLLCLAQKTEIDLAVTTRIRADAPHDPWKSQLRELFDAHGIKESGSVTRLDYWVLGVDRFPSERFLEIMSAIRARRPQAGKKHRMYVTGITYTATTCPARDVFPDLGTRGFWISVLISAQN